MWVIFVCVLYSVVFAYGEEEDTVLVKLVVSSPIIVESAAFCFGSVASTIPKLRPIKFGLLG